MNSCISSAELDPFTNPKSLQRLKDRRKFWLKVHLWLGLGLGLFWP